MTHYFRIKLLSHVLTFYEVKELEDFDMILGYEGLREMKAKLNFFTLELTYFEPKKSLEQKISYKLNYSINESVKTEFSDKIEMLMSKNNCVEFLPYNTKIKATIRTTDNEPVWSRAYPYPMSANKFVNEEIERLLKHDIIRPSRSPYNAPIWVVPKKGLNEDGTSKSRLVIDYKKLNAKTIRDRYPMPHISVILSNLGKAKFFSVIDLESGFHQILIEEKDREKTAFSVNGAKYEFNRLAFGLKNSPSVFQRAVDDVLRAFVGIFIFIYMDDVIIFSESKEQHMKHIELVITALTEANMKISSDKCKFFENEVEFLGHIVLNGKISVDPKKIETIKNFVIPKTVKQLRSFLGLSGYYRKFIRGYAEIVKPLTIQLKGDNARVNAKHSKNVKIDLDDSAKNAFDKIREKLQESVELFQPDYDKPFDLITDASNVAIGAVLEQNKRPIIFISRTLSESEQRLATNEKELLAVVWALQSLRNYLYGIADVTVFTDHQPLTFSVSEKNPNLKIKRCQAFVEECGVRMKYKPGNQNVVADALSRMYNIMIRPKSDSQSDCSIHSQISSPNVSILTVPNSINSFRNQIFFELSSVDQVKTTTIFPGYVRHVINYSNLENLLVNMEYAVQSLTNGIYATLKEIYQFGPEIIKYFPNSKFIHTTNFVRDITDDNEQLFLISQEHKRAHRNFNENYSQLIREYFFPNMKRETKKYVMNCEICKVNKYERHPKKQVIGKAPIPKAVGEMLH
ncbi:MAG: hypothetical protein JW729_00435, partial [Bacteroidales bacterium]|nr:hypothetical protein [Bacteroidales bacterium]